MTAYNRGRAFEYRVRDELLALNYAVFRMAGSHSPCDLIAIKKRKILFVQCKRDGWISPMERKILVDLSERCCGLAIVVSCPQRRACVYQRLSRPGGKAVFRP